MRSLLPLAAVALTTAHLVGAASGCGAPPPPALSLTSDVDAAPADGLSVIRLTAHLAQPGAVVSFTRDGVGLLSASAVQVGTDGTASVLLYAPLEEELTAAAASTQVHAVATIGDAPLRADVDVTFALPTDGAALLTLRAEPDVRVRAGSGATVVLRIAGRRLDDPTVTLSADDDGALGLPATVTLEDDGTGALSGSTSVVALPTPRDVTVTVTSSDGAKASLTLQFISDDAPAFDLNGTFAQVTYGTTTVSFFGFLDPDPQCVIAPTLSLVHATHSGGHVSFEYTTCDVKMPTVRSAFGPSETWVDPPFVEATNAASGGALEADVDDHALPAPFAPSADAIAHPLIVGAQLDNPDAALPTRAGDATQFDADGDGHPGVTIHNDMQGDQYTCFRTRTLELTGTIESSDLVTGTGRSTTESVLFNNSLGINPELTDLPSPWFLVRVDGRNGAVDIKARDGDPTSISCADVQAYAATLESDHPQQACN